MINTDFCERIKDFLEENSSVSNVDFYEINDNCVSFDILLANQYQPEVSTTINIECEPNIDSLLDALNDFDNNFEPNELAIEIIRNPEYDGWVTETYQLAYELSGVLPELHKSLEQERDIIEEELGLNKNERTGEER